VAATTATRRGIAYKRAEEVVVSLEDDFFLDT
jgi:hypothetical protein